MNVYLIGYRCSGNSSIGKLLSENLGWTFVDTDWLLVAQAGQEIAAIVESKRITFDGIDRITLSQ